MLQLWQVGHEVPEAELCLPMLDQRLSEQLRRVAGRMQASDADDRSEWTAEDHEKRTETSQELQEHLGPTLRPRLGPPNQDRRAAIRDLDLVEHRVGTDRPFWRTGLTLERNRH